MNGAIRHAFRRFGSAAVIVALVLAAAGCATVGSVPPGTPIDQLQARHGPPTFVFPRPEGGQRLEYGAGSWGLQTWMLDVDAAGRLVRAEQVRNERAFGELRDGMTREEVLSRIGHPSQVGYLSRQDHELWSYLYDNPFCIWFQVSIDRKTNRVAGTGSAIHPRCIWDRR